MFLVYSSHFVFDVQNNYLLQISNIIRFIVSIIFIGIVLSKLKIITKNYRAKNKPVKKVFILLVLFIIYITFQSLILFYPRGLLTVPKYVYLFSFITIFVLLYSNNKICKYSLNTFLALFVLITSLYVIQFISHPNIVFREFRPTVFIESANEDGGLLACLLPFVIYKYSSKRILWIILPIYLFLFYFLNGSRTTLIASIIIIILMVGLYYGRIKLLKVLYFFAFVIFIVINLPLIEKSLLKDENTNINLKQVWLKEQGKGNLEGRIGNIWAPVVKYTIKNSPLLGFGLGNWSEVTDKLNLFLLIDGQRSTGRSAHNMFVFLFAEVGIIGLFLFLLIIIFSIKSVLLNIKQSAMKMEQRLNISIALSWIGYLSWAMTANPYSIAGWSIFTILVTLSLTKFQVNSNESIVVHKHPFIS